MICLGGKTELMQRYLFVQFETMLFFSLDPTPPHPKPCMSFIPSPSPAALESQAVIWILLSPPPGSDEKRGFLSHWGEWGHRFSLLHAQCPQLPSHGATQVAEPKSSSHRAKALDLDLKNFDLKTATSCSYPKSLQPQFCGRKKGAI